jgi:hypothetical protein
MGAGTPKMLGQKWEFGGGAGGSIYKSQTIDNGRATASAGFQTGYAISGVLGHNNHNYLGGELRYTYTHNNLKLTSGSTKVTFGGEAHAFHYDLIVHLTPLKSRFRPYLSLGGGVKQYRGTGREVVFQPLGDLALLTHTEDTKGLLTAGGGIKLALARHVNLRIDFRDYITPFPKKVITPVGNTKVGGWIHDFVALLGFTFAF